MLLLPPEGGTVGERMVEVVLGAGDGPGCRSVVAVELIGKAVDFATEFDLVEVAKYFRIRPLTMMK